MSVLGATAAAMTASASYGHLLVRGPAGRDEERGGGHLLVRGPGGRDGVGGRGGHERL